MVIDTLQALDVKDALENFIVRKRLPEHITSKSDIGCGT